MEAAGSGHIRLERAQLHRLEAASLVEATTLVLLVGVAVPLKHAAYLWTVLQTVAGGGWQRRSRVTPKRRGRSIGGIAR